MGILAGFIWNFSQEESLAPVGAMEQPWEPEQDTPWLPPQEFASPGCALYRGLTYKDLDPLREAVEMQPPDAPNPIWDPKGNHYYTLEALLAVLRPRTPA